MEKTLHASSIAIILFHLVNLSDPICDFGGAMYSRDIGGDRTSVSGDRSVL